MFSEGGQPLHVRVTRGGGKGGGGGGSAPPPLPPPIVLTDPVSGKSFVDRASGSATGGMSGYMRMPGGGYAYIPPDQGTQPGQSAQDQLNAEITQRQATEKAASDAATAAAQQTSAQNESTFQQQRQDAYNTALQQAVRAFTQQGVDPNQYMQSDIIPALQYQMNTIRDLDPAPQTAFPTNLGATILGNVQSGARTQALNTLNQTFTPNYEQNMLPDSTLGNYVGNVVNQQFDPLTAQLQNAQRRGTLSGAGYSAALDALNQQKAAATSQVQKLGQGILSADRSDLTNYISGARSDANALNLGANFDPSSYAGVAAGKVQSDLSNFGGALTSAVGDTKFANINDLINAGGAVQGSQNPNAANPTGAGPTTAQGGGPLSAAYQDPTTLAQQRRGLGNVGAF